MVNSIKSTKPFANVVMEKVSVAGQEVPRSAIMVEDDSGIMRLAGMQGKEYQLITNSMAQDFAQDVMSRSEYSWNPLKTLWDGKRFASMFITSEKIAILENGESQSIFLGLSIRNSYDGSASHSMELFGFNFKCSNQYHHRNRFGFFAVRHTPHDTNRFDMQDALENISKGAINVIKAIPVIQSLRKRPIDVPLLLQAKLQTQIPTSKWGAVLDQLNKEESTAFGLFQALTSVTTHQLSGFSGITTNESVCEYFLNNAVEQKS